MSAASVSRAFAFLHRRTVRSFGGERFIWWPSAPPDDAGVHGGGEEDYAVPVPCVAATNRGRDQALMGAATMAADEIVLHADAVTPEGADAFPFEPRPGAVFLLGPADPEARVPRPDPRRARKYRVVRADRAEDYQSHWRITAERE